MIGRTIQIGRLWYVYSEMTHPISGRVVRLLWRVANWQSQPRVAIVEYEREGLWTAPQCRVMCERQTCTVDQKSLTSALDKATLAT